MTINNNFSLLSGKYLGVGGIKRCRLNFQSFLSLSIRNREESTLDCTLYWYPKFYKHVLAFVGHKPLETLFKS